MLLILILILIFLLTLFRHKDFLTQFAAAAAAVVVVIVVIIVVAFIFVIFSAYCHLHFILFVITAVVHLAVHCSFCVIFFSEFSIS